MKLILIFILRESVFIRQGIGRFRGKVNDSFGNSLIFLFKLAMKNRAKWGSDFEQETMDRRIFDSWQGKPTAKSEQTLTHWNGISEIEPVADSSSDDQGPATWPHLPISSAGGKVFIGWGLKPKPTDRLQVQKGNLWKMQGKGH